MPFLLFTVLIGLIFVPVVDASSAPSSHVIVYSTYQDPNLYIYVPVNSSGVTVYPDWHVYLYGPGSFQFEVNGSTIETGVSLGAFNFTYIFNLPGGAPASALLVFQGISYIFADIITGPLSNQTVDRVSVSSSYLGQDQFFTVAPGTAGALMYPDWTIDLLSSTNQSYTVTLNGQAILSGHVSGSKTLEMNVSGTSATVIIVMGKSVYQFPHEVIAAVPIQKYYGPQPPPLQYSLTQYEYGIARAFVASAFAIIIALFTARKYLLERERREVIRI